MVGGLHFCSPDPELPWWVDTQKVLGMDRLHGLGSARPVRIVCTPTRAHTPILDCSWQYIKRSNADSNPV